MKLAEGIYIQDTPNKRNILAFIDAPDPDNLAMLKALYYQNPGSKILIILTGRPVRIDADKSVQNWDWDLESSLMAQKASALRIVEFLSAYGIFNTRVFDGGIAPRTLVPHWIHFEDYYKFYDNNNIKALRYCQLESQDELIKEILKEDSWQISLGGPATGINQVITRNPCVVTRFEAIYAMFAMWGNIEAMELDPNTKRDNQQFNVACDPQGAHNMLFGLGDICPIYLMPTEVTRVLDIGFQTDSDLRAFLPDNQGTRYLMDLYEKWYKAAVEPRQVKNPEEYIFIHDFVSALSMSKHLRDQIYQMVPVEIQSVPYLVTETQDWGKVNMVETTKPTNIYAAASLRPSGAELYREELYKALA